MSDDSRRSVRVEQRLDFDYSVEGSAFTAELTDLSEHGAFVDATYPHEPGAELEFRFELPEGGGAISGRARVMWQQPMLGMGIRFLDLGDEELQRLRFFVGSVYFGFGSPTPPDDGSA